MTDSDWIQLTAVFINVAYLLWHSRKTSGGMKKVLNHALTQNRSLLSRALGDIAQTIQKEFGSNAVASQAVTVAEEIAEDVAHLQAGQNG